MVAWLLMFLRRYERELNTGSRPPLRKICTQDAPASCPMILCVSGITWSEEGVNEDGLPVLPHPKLEVTDGWYRLRVQINESLAKAVRNGVLKVGRKIAVAGMGVCILPVFLPLHSPLSSFRQNARIPRRFWKHITRHI